jgi:hypothetical protein
MKPWNKGKHIQLNTGKTHFKKGIIPWNKGIKMDKKSRENMSKGRIGLKLSELHKKNLSKRLKEDWAIGKRKGGWKHTEKWKNEFSIKTKGHKNYLPKDYIAWNRGKKFPELSGENHHNWIKDRTKLKKSERKDQDYAYRCWVLGVRGKDNWKCRLLSSECKGRLESHHIFNWIDYPELRYVLTNGITLCHFHHPRGREKEKRMIPIFQELLSVSEEQI